MKALIVDDEGRVRKAIRLLVHWDEHGIGQVDEAASGREAMEVVRKEQPQLVLLDMMMPLGDGVELMEWLHGFAPETKFIVISGHDDFEFVRNTVRYRGIDYILKPVDETLINVAVGKAVAAWRAEEKTRLLQLQTNVQVNEYRPFYTEKLLTSLIVDPGSQQQAARRLQAEGALPTGIGRVRLALLQFDKTDHSLLNRFGNELDLLVFALLNICNEFLREAHAGIAFRHWGTQSDIVLLVWRDFTSLSTLLARIHSGIRFTLGRNIHFGIGPDGSFPTDMPRLYATGIEALRSRNLLVMNEFVHRQVDRPEAPVLRFADHEAQWELAALARQPRLIEEAVEGWVGAIARNGFLSPKELELHNREIDRFQFRLLQETGGGADIVVRSVSDHDEPEETPVMPSPDKSIFSLSEWQRYWSYGLLNVSRLLLTAKMPGQDLMSDISAYLSKNYHQDLSLYDIAARFHVSREYVSRKFKQTYGVNVSEYVTGIRIDSAKLLLKNPQLKIAAIAEKIGFKNEKYFSLVFKKQEGLSPNEYRKREG